MKKYSFMNLFSSFLTSAVLAGAAVIALKYYIPFSNEAAGSYAIATLFGDSLKVFLIKALLLAAGILAFITFAVKAKRCRTAKRLYPFYMLGMGALWIALPSLSAYTVSRFTGNLTTQSVAGIAIIANVVFMMISVCCGIIAVTDIVHYLLSSCESNGNANGFAALLAGVPTGAAFALLLTSALIPLIGLSGVFIMFGVITAIAGVLDLLLNKAVK